MDYIVHKAVEASALSKKTQAKLNGVPRTWIVSPKYDGCHAIIAFDDGAHIGTFSRTGEAVYSLHHIARQLAKVVPKGRVAFCGEAWHPLQEFNVISGWFRRQDHSATDLWFAPFDIVDWNYNDQQTSGAPLLLGSNATYLARTDKLCALLAGPVLQVVTPCPFVTTGTLDSVLELQAGHARKLKAMGTYDGCIVADASGHYTVGAGKGGEFIKLKPLLSFTVIVTGAALDFGTKTGKNTAALKFVLDGLEQKVSTGLTQAQVDEITAVGWDGYRIEVEAMGKTVNGYLREPRFKGIRTDA